MLANNTLSEKTSMLPSILFDAQQFPFYAQQIIESYYLQPMRSKTQYTEHLQDGHIEREIHGAMHVSRVCLYVGILHQIIKEKFPDYVGQAIQILSEKYYLDEQSILLLTHYMALCHDAARQGEGHDIWEKESAV